LRRIFCETLGTSLQLDDNLQRIVSFSPAITETLFLLGAGNSIAGVSAFCARPEEARKKRVIGSYNTVDPRLLEQLNPDLIFTVTGYQREFALKLSHQMPVYAIELPVSIAGIVDMVVKVGLIVNKISEATALSRQLHETISLLKPVDNKPSVYVEIDFSGPVSFGAYSYITDALRLLGGESVFGKKVHGMADSGAGPGQTCGPGPDCLRSKDVLTFRRKRFAKPDRKENLAGFAGGSGGPCVSHSGAAGLFGAPWTQLHRYCNVLAEEVLVFSELVPVVERSLWSQTIEHFLICQFSQCVRGDPFCRTWFRLPYLLRSLNRKLVQV